MTILLNNHGFGNGTWKVELERQLPDRPVRQFGENFDPNEITFALVWNHPPGDLLRYPNLRAIFSLGAGAEHLIADTTLPDVPVVMLADPAVARDMAAHALYWVLDRHRGYSVYREQQTNSKWHRLNIRPAEYFRAGILGLGRIGTEVATQIGIFGYAVSGWDAFQKKIDGISTSAGADTMPEFLGKQDVVVNCLPLTDETRHLLGRDAFATMQPGTFLVSISRGAVIDDEALLDSLNAGHLSGAALDALEVEPLPEDHPFWSHPKVHITPHVSGATFASSAVGVICENIRKLENGEIPQPLFNRAVGY